MAEPLLQVRALRKQFGGVRATDELDLDVRPGEVHAVIGPNGAGKTTLIAQLSGLMRPDAGTIAFDGEDRAAALGRMRTALGEVVIEGIATNVPLHRDIVAAWDARGS